MTTGGFVISPDGKDSVPVRLVPGEHICGPAGNLLAVVSRQDAAENGTP